MSASRMRTTTKPTHEALHAEIPRDVSVDSSLRVWTSLIPPRTSRYNDRGCWQPITLLMICPVYHPSHVVVLTRMVCDTVNKDRCNLNAFLWRRMRIRLCSYTQSRRFSLPCYLYVLYVRRVCLKQWYVQLLIWAAPFQCWILELICDRYKNIWEYAESESGEYPTGIQCCSMYSGMYTLLHYPRHKRAESRVCKIYVCANICVYPASVA